MRPTSTLALIGLGTVLLACEPHPDDSESPSGPTSGILDESFANGGILRGSGRAYHVWVHGPGLLVARTGRISGEDRYQRVEIVRYTESGDLDPSFGHEGITSTDLWWRDGTIGAAAPRSDGGIYVAGMIDDEPVVRLYSDSGRTDSSFGQEGVVTLPSLDDELEIRPRGILVDEADAAIIYGSSSRATIRPFIALRVEAEGVVDTSFGEGGVAETDFDGVDPSLHSSEVHPAFPFGAASIGGGFLLGGTAGTRHALAAYTSEGQLDPTFGESGRALFDASADHADASPLFTLALSTRDSGAWMMGGEMSRGLHQRFGFLLAGSSDGTIDTSFGEGGVVVIEGSMGVAALQLADDTILFGGAFSDRMAVARMTESGAFDASFGTDGAIQISQRRSSDSILARVSEDLVRALAVQEDGKIVAAGESCLDGPISNPTPSCQAVVFRVLP